jgi:hypothetical protein
MKKHPDRHCSVCPSGFMKGRLVNTTHWTLAQEKAALQLRCRVVLNQLEKIQRIMLEEISDIRKALSNLSELETEVKKWDYEFLNEASQSKSQAGN